MRRERHLVLAEQLLGQLDPELLLESALDLHGRDARRRLELALELVLGVGAELEEVGVAGEPDAGGSDRTSGRSGGRAGARRRAGAASASWSSFSRTSWTANVIGVFHANSRITSQPPARETLR